MNAAILNADLPISIRMKHANRRGWMLDRRDNIQFLVEGVRAYRQLAAPLAGRDTEARCGGCGAACRPGCSCIDATASFKAEDTIAQPKEPTLTTDITITDIRDGCFIQFVVCGGRSGGGWLVGRSCGRWVRA